jgi:predicted nucleotidyltransferase
VILLLSMQRKEPTKEELDNIAVIMRKNGAVFGCLFGSYARGTAGYLSDIDVAVAFSKNTSLDEQEVKVEYIKSEMEKIYGRDKVDVQNISTIRSPLLRYIVTLGQSRKIFCDDENIFNKFANFARREYEDTQSLRNIQKRALKGLFT